MRLAQEHAYQGELLIGESMARHTSWRVGGPARLFYKPVDLIDAAALLQALPPTDEVMWIGLGSNLLVRDGGFDGAVVCTPPGLRDLRYLAPQRIYVHAGVPCAKVARFAARHNLGGAEFFAGIPGTMGGALAMNAGAFGAETWDVVGSVETIDRSGNLHPRQRDAYNIGYRSVAGPDAWFVGAILQLQLADGEQSRMQMRRWLKQRGSCQPTQLANAGSVFRNPPDDYAARLIEVCGLKGRRIGAAEISQKHANFIINTGGASAAQIESLIELIIRTVRQQLGVKLQPEVRIVGRKVLATSSGE